jgi:hypothetical protein
MDVIEQGRNEGRMSLRRAMWHKAMNEGNPTMMIWLSKNLLGFSDTPLASEANRILPWRDDDTLEDSNLESTESDDTDEESDDFQLTEQARAVIKSEVEAAVTGEDE